MLTPTNLVMFVTAFGCLSTPAVQTAPSPTVPTTAPAAAPQSAPSVQQATPTTAPAPDNQTDYPGAVSVPASPRNYQQANRPTDQPIDMIVIHDIEGTAESAVRWFENPRARATSHYVIDGTHGVVYQVVREHDVAWHSGNGNVNHRSIGIEHEGFAYRPGFYNPLEYEVSAKLVRSISTRYNIPRDRTHIIGHAEVPNANHPGQFGGSGGHTDPGPWWDWDSYMVLVRNDAGLTAAPTFPTVLHPGEIATASVTFTNLGDDPWTAPSSALGAGKASETDDASARRAKGLVYLGEWNPTYAPLSPASVFYGKGWTSPRYVAPVSADVAPGTPTTFTITLRGPLTAGPVTEQFRLIKLPTAPHPPVAFGPTLTAAIEVMPWDLTIDSSTPNNALQAPGWISRPGADSKSTIYAYPVPKDAGQANGQVVPTAATWQQTLPIGGEWDVYVRWTAGQQRTARAVYTVQQQKPAAATTGTPATATPTTPAVVTPPVILDQRTGGGAWQKLGRYTLNGTDPVQVTLAADGTPGSFVVADAVRFVGPFPNPKGFQPLDPLLRTVGPRP